jgi:hypothetical protein
MPAKKTPKKISAKKRSTKATKKVPPTSLSLQPAGSGFHPSYVELRTRLDAIEMGALHYLLSGQTDEERNQRAQQLIGMLSDASEQITVLHRTSRASGGASAARAMSLLTASEGDTENPCPDGWYNCQGVCSPYPCT